MSRREALLGLEIEVANVAATAKNHFTLATLDPSSIRYRQTQATAVDFDSPSLDALAASLSEELGWDANKHLFRRSPDGLAGFFPVVLAGWLVAQARLDSAISALERFADSIETNRIRYLEVMAISGLKPFEDAQLSDDISIVPAELLPASVPVEELTGRGQNPPNEYQLVPRIDAALVRKVEFGPVLAPKIEDSQDPDWYQGLSLQNADRSAEMRDLVNWLVLATHVPVFPIAHWFQVMDEQALSPTWSSGYAPFEWAWDIQAPYRGTSLDSDKLRDQSRRYLSLPEKSRRQLGISLGFFRRSRQDRVAPEEKALFLGIALEALLCPEMGEAVSYRFKVRGTLLLEGDAQERRKNRSAFDELYRLRSAAAHGDHFTSKTLRDRGIKRDVGLLLEIGEGLYHRVITAILDRGGVPDWDDLAVGL